MGWIELAADLDQMQASVNKVLEFLLTTNLLATVREATIYRNQNTNFPLFLSSGAARLLCVTTQLIEKLKHLVLHTRSHFIFVGLSGRDQQSASKRSACGHAAVLNIQKPRARA